MAPRCDADWIIEALPALVYAGVALTDGVPHWATLYHATGSAGFLGYPSDTWADIAGRWAEIIHPNDREGIVAAVAAAPGPDGIFRAAYRMAAADGTYRWVEERASVETRANGLLWRGLIVDVTEREEAKARAIEAERLLEAIVLTIPAGAVIAREDGRCLWANPRMRDLVGFDVAGRTNEDMGSQMSFHAPDGTPLPPLDWPATRTARTGERLDGALVSLRRPDGRELQMQVSSVPIELPGESHRTALATYTDVSALQEAVGAARASDEIHSSVLTSLAEGVVVFRATGEVIVANAAAERTMGGRTTSLVGGSLDALRLGGIHGLVRGMVDRVFACAAGVHDELLTFPMPDGGVRYVSANAEPVHRPGHGDVWAVVVSFADVTEREQTTERLRFAADVLDQVGDAVVAVDLLGRVTAWNAQAALFSGVSAADAMGRVLREAVELDEKRGLSFDAIKTSIAERGRAEGPVRVRLGDRRELDLEVSATIQRGADGRAIGTLAVMRDVTERRRLEAQYIQSQKTEALGRMASGVAHDVNNALTVINGYGTILARRLKKAGDERSMRDTEQILRATQSAAGVTARLLAFARPTEGTSELFDPAHDIIDSALLLERLVGEGVELSFAQTSTWSVCAAREHLQQVLFNLASNARDAMDGRGRLRIEVDDVSLRAPRPHRQGAVPAGDWVRIDIADSGCGMDDATLTSLFEPFFTTKAVGVGTGLGLTISRELVTRAGGVLTVETTPGAGTTFSIWLPAVRETAAAVEPVKPSTPEMRDQIRILLVEDHSDLRILTEKILIDEGHIVIPAASAEEALGYTLLFDGPLDLLLCDVILPGMSGPELADQLRARWPDLPVLYVSGYTGERLSETDLRIPGASLLPKPFTPAQLAARIRRAIEPPERAQAPGTHSP